MYAKKHTTHFTFSHLISGLPLTRPGKIFRLFESVSSSAKTRKSFQPHWAVTRIYLEKPCKELSKVPST